MLVCNMPGSVCELCKFFEHGKRQDKLVEVIELELPDVKKKRVQPFYRSRWVECHDGTLEVYVGLDPAIVGALHNTVYGEDSVS